MAVGAMTAAVHAGWAALVLVVLSQAACHVEETQARCERNDDCDFGNECYLGYCVPRASDAAIPARDRDAATSRDASASSDLRRRKTPMLTEFADDDGGTVVGQANQCLASEDEDAGASQGACCQDAVPCYDGPEGTLGVGRCQAGRRPCEDGTLGACEDSVLPRAEACDNEGADDDCDGELDNIDGRGDVCTLEASLRRCGEGALECPGDGSESERLLCLLKMPPAELCNQSDDDCDGKVDEAFDLQKDAMNCGACGSACMGGQACCGGACIARVAGAMDGCPECSDSEPCAAGKTCCQGACVDVSSDQNHCGACGTACAGRQTCCAGSCVDTRGDEKNCGGCGVVCDQGKATTCCASSCVDVATDDRHCGQCGNSCGPICSCESSNGQPVCRGSLGFCFR